MILEVILVSIFAIAGFPQHVHSKIVPVVDPKYEDCVKGESAGILDMSGVKLVKVEGKYFLNGDFKIKQELTSPWTVTISTEQLKRDQWIISIFNRFIPDFCPVLKAKHEFWYNVTKHVEGDCPFPAGTVEKFNMVPVTDQPAELHEALKGKGRITLKSTFLRGARAVSDCVRIYFEFVEEDDLEYDDEE